MTDDAQKEVPPTERLTDIALDDSAVIRRSPEVEHERAVAIYDLLEDNFLRPRGDYSGPYHLRLSIAQTLLQLDLRDDAGQRLRSVAVPDRNSAGVGTRVAARLDLGVSLLPNENRNNT